MKVLYLVSGIGPPSGWGTEYIQNLVFELTKKEVRATIISPIYGHTDSNWRKWIETQHHNYNVNIIPLELPRLIQNNLLLSLAITPLVVTYASIKLMLRERFDLIEEFSSTPIILLRALILKLIFNTNTLFTLSVYNNTVLGKLFWFKFFNFAQYYLIPSQEIINNLIKLGIDKNKILYSPPGIDIKNFTAQKNQLTSRSILGLPNNKFILSFFGSLTKEKGVNDLIKTIRLLEKKFENKIFFAIFAVWKGSTQHNRLKDQIISMSPDYVNLFEQYIDIPTLLSASDLILLPQQTGHGATIPIISVLECVAANKLVITTDIIGNRELVGKSNIILIPPKNSIALAKAIEKVYLDNRQKRVITTKPAGNSLERFNIDKSTQLHLNLYSLLKAV